MRSRVLSTGKGLGQGVEPPRLIVLLADGTIPEVHRTYGDYHDIFSDLFGKSLNLAADGRADAGGLALEVRSFDAKAGEYPDQAELDAATGLLITGSASSAYEPAPWIIELISFTSAVSRTHPKVKLFGICFGHQIVSMAFGGQVEKNARGWELGVRTVDLTPLGSKVLGKRKDDGTVRIFQVHQDIASLPPGFENLGSTAICSNQGMLRLVPSAAGFSSLTDISVLAVQGHPEFLPDLVLRLIDSRERRGIISSQLADESRRYAKEHDDGIWLGRVCLGVMGI